MSDRDLTSNRPNSNFWFPLTHILTQKMILPTFQVLKPIFFLLTSHLTHKQIPCTKLQQQTASLSLDSAWSVTAMVNRTAKCCCENISQMMAFSQPAPTASCLILSWSSLLEAHTACWTSLARLPHKILSYQVCHSTYRSPYHSSSILVMLLPQNLYTSYFL